MAVIARSHRTGVLVGFLIVQFKNNLIARHSQTAIFPHGFAIFRLFVVWFMKNCIAECRSRIPNRHDRKSEVTMVTRRAKGNTMQRRMSWIVAIVCLVAFSGMVIAADESLKDPDLAADLRLLQGQWELFNRGPGEGPPSIRSVKQIEGNRETLRRYDLDTGKLVQEHTMEFRLSKDGDSRVFTFYPPGKPADEGLSFIYKIDNEAFYDIPGLLNGPKYRNYAPIPKVWVWKRVAEETVEKEIPEPRATLIPPLDIVLASKGRQMIVAEGTFMDPGPVYTVNLDNGWRGSSVSFSKGCSSLTWIPSRNEVVSTCWDSNVRVLSWPSLETRLTIPIDRSATRADVSPDGKLIAVLREGYHPSDDSAGRSLDLYDVETGAIVKPLDTDLFRGLDVVFSRDGDHLAICGGLFENLAGEIVIYDVKEGKRKARATTKQPLANLAYSTDGRWIVSTGNLGTTVVDSETAREKVSIPEGGQRLVVLPRKNLVVIASRQQSLIVATLPDLKIVKKIDVNQGPIGGLASRQEGEELIVVGMMSSQIWNTNEWTSTPLMPGRTQIQDGQLVSALPQGELVAIGKGRELRIVDQAFRRLWNLKEFSEDIRQIKVHPSENQLGVILKNGSVEILDATTGETISEGQVPLPPLSVLSSDLTEFFYISPDNRIICRELSNQSERPSSVGFGARFSSLTSSRNGNICCGMAPGAAVVLSPDANKLVVRILKAVPGPVACMDWYDPHQRAAVGDESGNLAIWEIQDDRTPKLVKKLTLGIRPTTLGFSKSGDQIVIGSAEGVVSIVAAGEESKIQNLTRKTFKPVVNCVWLNDDRDLLFANSEGKLRRLKTPSRQIPALQRQTASENQPIRSACFNREGDQCFVAIGRDIEIRSTSNWELKQTLRGHRDDIQRIRMSPDGKTLTSTGNDAFVQVRTWDDAKASWNLDRTLFLPAAAHRLEWSPDGRSIVVGFATYNFLVYDTATWQVSHKLSLEYIPKVLRFSPDGKLLMSAGHNPSQPGAECVIQQWDTRTWNSPKSFKGHRTSVEDIAFVSDGQTMFSTGDDGQVLRWSLANGTSELAAKLPMSGIAIKSMQNPRYALVSWHFGNLGIIDTANGKLVIESEGHTEIPEAVTSDLVISNNGELAVSCCASRQGTGTGVVKLWQIGSGNKSESR